MGAVSEVGPFRKEVCVDGLARQHGCYRVEVPAVSQVLDEGLSDVGTIVTTRYSLPGRQGVVVGDG